VLQMRRVLMVLGGAFLVVGSMTVALTGGTALAQSHRTATTCAYSTDCGGLSSSSGTAPPGGTITLSGHGYAPDTSVTINVCGGLETLTVETGSTGDFTVTVTIPSSAQPGSTCVITADGRGTLGQTLTTSTSVLITSGTTVPVSPTGEPWSGQLYWALTAGIGLAGFGLFEFGRRRRFRSTT
jgi:hypothetical protein